MNTLENVIMTFGVFGSAVLVVFILARYNYLIKKVIAENGGAAQHNSSRVSFMDVACMVISVGIGLAISSIITVFNMSEDTMDLLIYAIIMVCGGIGLIAAHYMRKRA